MKYDDKKGEYDIQTHQDMNFAIYVSKLFGFSSFEHNVATFVEHVSEGQ